MKYRLNCGDEWIIEGETDEYGRTDVVWTDSPEDTQLVLDSLSNASEDPYHYEETNTETF